MTASDTRSSLDTLEPRGLPVMSQAQASRSRQSGLAAHLQSRRLALGKSPHSNCVIKIKSSIFMYQLSRAPSPFTIWTIRLETPSPRIPDCDSGDASAHLALNATMTSPTTAHYPSLPTVDLKRSPQPTPGAVLTQARHPRSMRPSGRQKAQHARDDPGTHLAISATQQVALGLPEKGVISGARWR